MRIPINDIVDHRLADYVALTDVELRRAREPAAGLFIAEGEKVIRRALAAGFRIRSILLDESSAARLSDIADSDSMPAYIGAPDLLERVTGYHVHRGALAAFARRPLPSLDDVLATARCAVVLEDVNDHTNIGAIFRGAAALGMDAVVLSPRCADPLYRRAVKVSMGAVFTLPYTRLDDWYHGPDLLRAAGFRVLALTPDPGAAPLDAVALSRTERYAVLFGAEGAGLSRRWLRNADVAVRIPMARDIDSLNVAAAAAVVFYAIGRMSDNLKAVADP